MKDAHEKYRDEAESAGIAVSTFNFFIATSFARNIIKNLPNNLPEKFTYFFFPISNIKRKKVRTTS